MSDKPNWCPNDIWEQTGMTFDQLYDAEPDLEGACEQGVREYAARIAIHARSQAFEECAKIAENYREDMSFWMHSEWKTAKEASGFASKSISQAIRQHSQKGRDK